jgi:hypothetical protein
MAECARRAFCGSTSARTLRRHNCWVARVEPHAAAQAPAAATSAASQCFACAGIGSTRLVVSRGRGERTADLAATTAPSSGSASPCAVALAMAATTAASCGSASPNSYPYALAVAMAATTARPCASAIAIALEFQSSSRRFPKALDRLAHDVRMEWAASSRQGRGVHEHDGKRKRLSGA